MEYIGCYMLLAALLAQHVRQVDLWLLEYHKFGQKGTGVMKQLKQTGLCASVQLNFHFKER